MEKNELKAALEALLFIGGDPISLKQMKQVIEEVANPDILEALEELKQSYEEEGRGLQIIEVAGGYQMATREEVAPILKRLEKVKAPNKLSRSALETLAVISYKQPMTRGEVEAIRGVDSAYVIRSLLERRIVKIVGRREGVGRPMLYGTTSEFLQCFGLKDLSELPALKDFKEISESLPEQEPAYQEA